MTGQPFHVNCGLRTSREIRGTRFYFRCQAHGLVDWSHTRYHLPVHHAPPRQLEIGLRGQS